MMHAFTFVLAAAVAVLPRVYGTEFSVQVGPNGMLAYSPDHIDGAKPKDIIHFTFNPKNHTVTQSSFVAPCTELDGGFNSHFQPVSPNATEPVVVSYVVPESITKGPLWFYCQQTGHCSKGMVFGINPTQDKSMDAFIANALATANTTDSPPAASTVPSASTTSTVAAQATASSPVVHKVSVGLNGTLTFTPPFLSAAVGDTVRWIFHPKNHSVIQSSFENPCTPTNLGFASGFVPVGQNVTEHFPMVEITVRDDKPFWAFCAQSNHCEQGMVFAINPPVSGNKTFNDFLNRAKALNA